MDADKKQMSTETNTLDEKIAADGGEKKPDIAWLVSSGLITAIAIFLRFFWLGLKPFHHDEGVNGFFLTTLFNDGVYKYDPANYHGPTLYYIALAFTKVFGLETLPVRWSVAIFGVLTVVLALFLKRYIGKTGALFAALLLALSPGMVYISRYFIHEMLFVFLSLAIVVAILFFVEKRAAGPFAITWMALLLLICFLPSTLNLAGAMAGKSTTALWALRAGFFIIESILVFMVMRMLVAWNSGTPIYFLLAAASTVLLFATKETGFITLGTMGIARLCIWIWRRIARSELFDKNKYVFILLAHGAALAGAVYYNGKIIDGAKWFYETMVPKDELSQLLVFFGIVVVGAGAFAAWIIFLIRLREPQETGLIEPVDVNWSSFYTGPDLLLLIASAAVLFVYVGILFFSSFFSYAGGVKGAVEAYMIWTKTGSKDHTQNGALAYVKWLSRVEAPILILSALGTLIALLKARHRFAMFTGLWAFGLAAAYTIIPYKTPWLALSFLLPMCIIAGYGINELAASKDIPRKILAAILAVAASGVLAYQTYELNFVRYDDNDMPYIYAHTKREFLEMMNKIEYYAEKSGRGKGATIEIVSPDYWPMVWYTRDFEHANYSGQLVDANTAEMIVAKKDDQDQEVIKRYSAHYKYVGTYPLRPGVDLMLLVRKDLADKDTQELYRINSSQPLNVYAGDETDQKSGK
jgi:predicted membrane-bound mannosyltransferase